MKNHGAVQPSLRIAGLSENGLTALSEARARLRLDGTEVIDLSEGSPDFAPSNTIREALANACKRPDVHGYSAVQGLPSLRSAFLEHLQKRGSDVTNVECIIGAGSKELIGHLSQALLGHGDVVLVPALAYPFYRAAAQYAGAEVIVYPLTDDGNYLPELSRVPDEILSRTKLIWLNTPHNPTGAVLPADFLQDLIHFCRARQIVVACDLAYSDITFERDFAPAPLACGDRSSQFVIEVHSLSKNINIAGWRVGFLVGDPTIVSYVAQSRTVFGGGSFVPIQLACRFALDHFTLLASEVRETYRARADSVVRRLEKAEVCCVRPRGSFYIWAATPDGGCDVAFSKSLLDKTRVLVTPGSAFGTAGRGWIRLSLTRPPEILDKAIDRLVEFCADHSVRPKDAIVNDV